MTIGNRFAVRALTAAVAAGIAASAANVQADDALQAAWEQRYSGLGTTSGDAD
jgi:hypothetical protein